MKRIISIALTAPIVLALFSAVAIAQSESREVIFRQIETKRAELSALEKNFLEPSVEDRRAFAEFLRQPDTGLTRLLPREGGVLTIRGGGAYYSFTRLTHEYGYGSDISLEQGNLTVGFVGADYGMLTKVGDVSLDEITLEHPSVRFIAAYNPAATEPEARLEQRRFASGVNAEGLSFKNRLAAEAANSYVLRSIDYYSKSNVLVALRVVRKDMDGSVVILWKLLKNYPKPELAQNQSAQ